jgi:hypothetical protein
MEVTAVVNNKDIEQQLVRYVKWCVVELATNGQYDHRYPKYEKTESRLKQKFLATQSLDDSIVSVIKELIQDMKFSELYQKYLSAQEDEDNEEKENLFYYVNTWIGLHEIICLEYNDRYTFMDYFLCTLSLDDIPSYFDE